MSTTYHKMETHSDLRGGDVISLTSCAGRTSKLEPDRSRIQVTIESGSSVFLLNRQQALILAQKLLALWTGEELERVD